MPLPAAYTEATLSAFMIDDLSEVGAALGWAVQADVQEAVNEVLVAYGVEDVADATEIGKVRALARVMAWRAACAALVARYDFADPDGRYSRGQMLKGARSQLADAEYAAGEYLPRMAVRVDTVGREYDPYTPLTEAQIEGLYGG